MSGIEAAGWTFTAVTLGPIACFLLTLLFVAVVVAWNAITDRRTDRRRRAARMQHVDRAEANRWAEIEAEYKRDAESRKRR